jgi:hypothetical protein
MVKQRGNKMGEDTLDNNASNRGRGAGSQVSDSGEVRRSLNKPG